MPDNKLYDFRAWLETRQPDEEYHFVDCIGNCLMGQYMASKGKSWSMPSYQEHVEDVIGGRGYILQDLPQTFGGALKRVRKVLENA